jgi:hypothetical protein
MTKTCTSPRRCAAAVRLAAMRVRRQGMRETDLRMRRMYIEDAGDMLAVASAVARGDKTEAARIAFKMDTAARDEIPLSVFCWFAPESVIRGCR